METRLHLTRRCKNEQFCSDFIGDPFYGNLSHCLSQRPMRQFVQFPPPWLCLKRTLGSNEEKAHELLWRQDGTGSERVVLHAA
jgi:hypothetical protein